MNVHPAEGLLLDLLRPSAVTGAFGWVAFWSGTAVAQEKSRDSMQNRHFALSKIVILPALIATLQPGPPRPCKREHFDFSRSLLQK